MKLKLEVGKKYIDSEGGVTRIIAADKVDGPYCFVGLLTEKGADKEDVASYTQSGVGEWAHDLVSEFDEYAEWKNLPVDSKIIVDGYGNRHFSSFNPEERTVEFFQDGATSWSTHATIIVPVTICTIVKD